MLRAEYTLLNRQQRREQVPRSGRISSLSDESGDAAASLEARLVLWTR
jgi:hypothetical protein